MSFATAVFVYFLVWWTMLFTVLPLGVERHNEDGKGYDAGAPKHHNLKKKMIINTVVSAIIVGIMHILAVTGVVDWYAMFDGAWK